MCQNFEGRVSVRGAMRGLPAWVAMRRKARVDQVRGSAEAARVSRGDKVHVPGGETGVLEAEE